MEILGSSVKGKDLRLNEQDTAVLDAYRNEWMNDVEKCLRHVLKHVVHSSTILKVHSRFSKLYNFRLRAYHHNWSRTSILHSPLSTLSLSLSLTHSPSRSVEFLFDIYHSPLWPCHLTFIIRHLLLLEDLLNQNSNSFLRRFRSVLTRSLLYFRSEL